MNIFGNGSKHVKAKFARSRWYSSPRRCAKIILEIRELSVDDWQTLPPDFIEQYNIMQHAQGPVSSKFELKLTGQNVKFFNTAVSASHQFAAMGTELSEFTLRKQQAEGAKADEVVLSFAVLVDLDNASCPWMGNTFGNELLITVEEAQDPQAPLPLQ